MNRIHRTSFWARLAGAGIFREVLFASVMLAGMSPAFAQPFTLDEDIQPVELKLVNYNPPASQEKGMICLADVKQTRDTQYFFIKGFSIYSPSFAGITAGEPDAPIEIGLFKANWRTPDASGNTGEAGHWEKGFKTEGDFGIRVVPRKLPATYSLVVWTGKEADISMPSALAKAAPLSEKKKEGGFPWLLAVGGFVFMGALILFILKKNKK